MSEEQTQYRIMRYGRKYVPQVKSGNWWRGINSKGTTEESIYNQVLYSKCWTLWGAEKRIAKHKQMMELAG